jgi:transcriptional regulator with XRE-family HTH domain
MPSGRELEPPKTLGGRIRQVRKLAGLTLEGVAIEIGVTKGAVSAWENNLNPPDVPNLAKFCRLVGVAADYVLLGRGDILLGQLTLIYDRLSHDGRDSLLVRANRILSEEQPGPNVHDPFGGKQTPSGAPAVVRDADGSTAIRKHNQSRGLEEQGNRLRIGKAPRTGKAR